MAELFLNSAFAIRVPEYVRWRYSKLVPGLYTELGWQDLAALHLPGHLMTINGLKDQLYSLKAAQDAVDKIKRMFVKAGLPDHYQGVFFDGPHEFNLDMQTLAFDWLDKRAAEQAFGISDYSALELDWRFKSALQLMPPLTGSDKAKSAV